MKRSEINAIIRDADQFIRQHAFYLPPFAYWTGEVWLSHGTTAREIVQNKLGWDITDFGRGNYQKFGLFLFTLRNGRPENLQTGHGKVYAEKIMVVNTEQMTPLHFHWRKTEDIINRGGGNLIVQVYNSTEADGLAVSDVQVNVDGIARVVQAGGSVTLAPGESITLPTRCYHQFWGVQGRVLVGEVSSVNDDDADNRFYERIGRFPTIEEDEPPLYLLVNDYATLADGRYDSNASQK